LRNLSGDVNQEYFSDGTTDQLITNLAHIRALKVISRTSVLRYKGTTKTIPEISRELGVDAILEGSVQRAGPRVHISARLVRGASDSSVWAQEFERDAADVLGLEGEIARAIASAIRVTLTRDEINRLGSHRINPDAFDAYLRGRYFSWNFNDHDQAESIRHFQDAIRFQPDFAAAHAGVASGWITRVVLGFIPYADGAGPGRAAAQKALQLDPDLPDAHEAMGNVLANFDWNWSAGEKEFQRAIELDPNLPDPLNDYSYFLVLQGRLPEAIASIERAAALDPLNPGIQVTYGLALLRARRYTEAEPHARRALELDPADQTARGLLLSVAEMTGDLPSARQMVERGVRARNGDVMQSPIAGRLFAKLGRGAQARQVLANVTRPGASASPSAVAALCAALGDTDQAFEWLHKAIDSRRISLTLKTDAAFDPIRADARFGDVLRRMGLPAE
jgi:TolB-like protein/Tfp pilus assembly protein PilF